MLIQKEINDFEIDEGQLEKTNILLGNGKIRKIFVVFEKDTAGASLTILTKEGEVVLDVESSLEPEVYYPRVNTSSGRYQDSISAVVEENQARMEPFYFFGGLVVKVERDEAGETQKIIKHLSILYDGSS